MESNVFKFEPNSTSDWYKRTLTIQVTLSMPSISKSIESCADSYEDVGEQTFTLTLNFFHVAIILCKQNTIKNLLNNGFSNSDWWIKPVLVDGPNWAVVEEEKWIKTANCLHLAAKFNPVGLHLLLSQLENKESIIQNSHRKGEISPLHVCTANTHIDDSRSTW